MTQKRLSEIIVYIESLCDSAHKHFCLRKDGSKLQSEAVGAYTSLSHVLSILREEVTPLSNK